MKPAIPDKRSLKSLYEAQIPALEKINDLLHRRLKAALTSAGVHATVKTRVKSFESYYRKLLKRLSPLVVERPAPRGGSAPGDGRAIEAAIAEAGEARDGHPPAATASLLEGSPLTDIIGIRIVCPFLDDIETACSLLHRTFEVLEIENKGARHSFREFGYQATHFLIEIDEQLVPAGLTAFRCFTDLGNFLAGGEVSALASLERGPIVVEAQICTLLQDAWSEVEHELIYKSEFSPLDEPLKRKLAALNANLTLSDIIFQEIREYQRELHRELRKRRQGFLSRVLTDGRGGLTTGEEAGHEEVEGHGVSSSAGMAGCGTPIRTPTPAREPTSDHAGHRPRAADRRLRSGDNIDDLLLEALTAHNAGHYEEAIGIYSAILDRGPETRLKVILLHHRGMAYFASSAYDLALDDFSQAVALDPTDRRSFSYRAGVYRALGDLDAALRDLDRSLELGPFDFDALYARSRVERELGDLSRALADCDGALRIDPHSSEASAFRSQILKLMGM